MSPAVRRFAHGSRVPGWDDAADLWKDPASIPDPATTEVPPQLRGAIEDYMARYPDRRSAAIPALAAVQRHHGWCSPEGIEQAASVMRLTPGYLTAVATFYDMLQTTPVGRHDVYVCTNISCSLRGADELYGAIVDAAGDDPDFNVRGFECLGACDIAPMASVDGVYVGPLEPADAEQLVDDVRAGRPVLESKQLRRRRVADPEANEQEADAGPAHPIEQEPQVAQAGATDPAPDPQRMAVGEPMRDVGGEQPAPDHGEEQDAPSGERHEGRETDEYATQQHADPEQDQAPTDDSETER